MNRVAGRCHRAAGRIDMGSDKGSIQLSGSEHEYSTVTRLHEFWVTQKLVDMEY